MKYLIIIIILVSSCETRNKKRDIYVHMSNGSGWNYSSSHILVDSVTETTPKSATIWMNGRKTTIYAERIMFSN